MPVQNAGVTRLRPAAYGAGMTLEPLIDREQGIVRHGRARFTIITPVCIRLEYQAEGRFIDTSSLFAVDRDARCAEFTVTQDQADPRRIMIETACVTLTFTADDRPFYENVECRFESGGFAGDWSASKHNSRIRNLGGTLDSLDRQDGPVELGEGLLSRDGWYCIDDSSTPLLVDDWVQPRPGDAGSDWYLFAYGRDYRAAFQALTAVAGPVPLPRKYLLGCWYSRWHAYTSQAYRELVDEYDRHDYPLDVLVWDMDWHRQDATEGLGWAWTKGWTGFSWNRELLPDAEALLGDLRDRGIAVTLNVHPHDGLRQHEDMYAAFMRELGRNPDTGAAAPFEAGDRRYVEAYFKHTHTPLEEAGVAFWWVDWQQDILMPWVGGVPGLRHQPWLNALYHRQTARGGRRGVSFSRWAGWGDHRHPIHFSGDASSTWAMLAFQVPYTATAGNTGCFFWSHDMGGFCGCDDAERYARWLQFGAVSAAMRLHGVGEDRRPWTWPEWVQPALRRSFVLRSRLMPYLYSAIAQSCRDSMPFIRPLYLDSPDDPAAYRNPQVYRFGEALLVAPVVTPGTGRGRVGRQVVRFPDGPWYNMFTGERFDGPCERLVCATLDEFPLYVRGGVPLPLQPFTRRPGTTVPETLVVRCFPGMAGEDATGRLYEDDGVSDGYRQGAYSETAMACERRGDTIRFRLEPAHTGFDGLPARRTVRLELVLTEPSGPAMAAGCALDARRETVDGLPMTVVEIPAHDVSAPLEVTLAVRELDTEACRLHARQARADGLAAAADAVPAPAELALCQAVASGDAARVEALLTLWGVGLVYKDETPYRFGAEPTLYLYADPDVPAHGRVELALFDGAGKRHGIVTVHEGDYPVAVPLPATLNPSTARIEAALRIGDTVIRSPLTGFRT